MFFWESWTDFDETKERVEHSELPELELRRRTEALEASLLALPSITMTQLLGARDVFASKNGNDLPKKACPDPGSNYVEKRGELAS